MAKTAKAVQRLDKVLSNMGYGTRKEVKELARKAAVTVDGIVVRDSATHVDPAAQVIEVNGERLEYRDFIYLMLNKPEGVVSATEDSREETVVDLLDEIHRVHEPFPVGRLDKDTVGLLLLTNDGELAHGLLSPKRHVTKVYEALVEGVVGQTEVEAIQDGVQLDDGYTTLPALLEVLAVDETEGCSRVHITITEGKYHQVKRMFLSLGMAVLWLKRIAMGPLTLDEQLEPGEYRELEEGEVEALRKAARRLPQ